MALWTVLTQRFRLRVFYDSQARRLVVGADISPCAVRRNSTRAHGAAAQRRATT